MRLWASSLTLGSSVKWGCFENCVTSTCQVPAQCLLLNPLHSTDLTQTQQGSGNPSYGQWILVAFFHQDNNVLAGHSRIWQGSMTRFLWMARTQLWGPGALNLGHSSLPHRLAFPHPPLLPPAWSPSLPYRQLSPLKKFFFPQDPTTERRSCMW